MGANLIEASALGRVCRIELSLDREPQPQYVIGSTGGNYGRVDFRSLCPRQ